MTLTVLSVKAAQPGIKPYKVADSAGLYLLVNPVGTRLWRFDFRFAGKRKTLAIGKYPDVSLAEAREQRDDARKALRTGTDPTVTKRARKLAAAFGNSAPSFAQVAGQWFEARRGAWVEGYSARVWSRIRSDILPLVGSTQIDSVTPEHLLVALREIEARGSIETAHRVRRYIHEIFKFAKANKLVAANPAADLGDALAKPAPAIGRLALKARDLPEFLAALETYDGDEQTRLALKLVLLTFVRTSEARFARWPEFEDLDGPEPLWRIPAERMKMRTEHLVPLAGQTLGVLKSIRGLRNGNDLLFPAPTGSGVMSENTMLFALYRMGYHSRATVHGLRSTASTILNEKGFNRDWIERQLAHTERDDVRRAYNAAQWLSDRRLMMAWWANHLNEQTGNTIKIES